MSNYIINFTDPLKGNFIIRPYTSDGNRFPTTSVKNSTSTTSNSVLLLYGKGHPDYGERTDENLLHLAENFSGASAPVLDVSGHTNAGILWHRERLYFAVPTADITSTWYEWIGGSSTSSPPTGGQWVAVSVSGTPQPATPSNGQLWFDGSVLRRYSDDERGIQ